MDIIVGTAGHIDHGKTALVKALTGVDADRLPEEKERGITIDLGFAKLNLGDVKVGFVDVPGHEKFVKNMLAGASGIDLVLLVIAADEGVMPQTREHFEICRLLGIEHGIVVLTKSDLVEEEFLDLVKLDVSELVENSFLNDAPVISVSSKTGDGIVNLKKSLNQSISDIPTRKNDFVTRLPIDRVFTVKGFGAVVTGTLATGDIDLGTEKELLPIAKKVRVRGLQTHGKDVEKAVAGQRTAVNLGGIDYEEIERGMILSEPDMLRSTQIIDAEVEVLADSIRSLKTRQRVRVHLGTVEALARIQVLNSEQEIAPGQTGFAQIRFESPVVAIPFERFILRQYSPLLTIAGGRILDARAEKHRTKDLEKTSVYLEALIAAENENDKPGILKLYLENNSQGTLTLSDLIARTGWKKDTLENALNDCVQRKAVIKCDEYFVARTLFDRLMISVFSTVEDHHLKEPLSPGVLRETLRERVASRFPAEVFKVVLTQLEEEEKAYAEKDIVRAFSHSQKLSGDEEVVSKKITEIYRNARLQVPALDNVLEESIKNTSLSKNEGRKVLQLALSSGDLLRISDSLVFSRDAIESLTNDLKRYADDVAEDRLIDVAKFKELADVSRKYAIPLLEYFDAEKVTRRAGNQRLII